MDRRTVLRRGAALGVASVAAGCLEDSAQTDGDWDVGMTATAFEPRTVSIEPGATVVWFNNSSKVHTVTAYEGSLPAGAAYFSTGGFESEDAARQAFANGSGHLRPDEEFSHTFEVPGRYDYFCIPHERANMVGAVEVGDVEAGDVEVGDVEAGDVEAGDVEAGDVEAGDLEAGDIGVGDVDGSSV